MEHGNETTKNYDRNNGKNFALPYIAAIVFTLIRTTQRLRQKWLTPLNIISACNKVTTYIAHEKEIKVKVSEFVNKMDLGHLKHYAGLAVGFDQQRNYEAARYYYLEAASLVDIAVDNSQVRPQVAYSKFHPIWS